MLESSIRRRSRSGMALALVLLALAVSFCVGLAFLNTSGTATPAARSGADAVKARMTAESGLALALAYVGQDAQWRSNRPNGLWLENQAFGGGSYSLWGEDGSPAGPDGQVIGDGSLSNNSRDPLTVTALGSFDGASCRVRAILTPSPSSTLAVSERIMVKDSGRIDSYSSTAGAYGPDNQGQEAVISSNGVARAPVTLGGSSTLEADIYVGPGADPEKAISAYKPGAIKGKVGVLDHELPVPVITVPPMPPSVGDRAYNGESTLSSDVHCQKLTIGGTLHVQGDVKIVADGDVSIGNNAVIEVGRPMAYAAVVAGPIQVLDQALIDSYDSSAGAYGGSNVLDSAALATNAVSPGSITISGTVKGEAKSGPGSDPAEAISVLGGTLTGDARALSTPASIPDPAPWPPSGASTGDYAKATGTATIAADLNVDNFRITGATLVRIKGNRVIRVSGQLLLDDTAKVEMQKDSSLRIYVGGSIQVSNQAQLNVNTKDTTLLTIYGLGQNLVHNINGSAQVYGIVDAPASALCLADTARVYGTFMGSSLTVRNSARFHHDQNPALVTVDSRLPLAADPNSRLTVYIRGGLDISGNPTITNPANDPTKVIFKQLTDEDVSIGSSSVVQATIIAPESTCHFGGNGSFLGKIQARALDAKGSVTIRVPATNDPNDPGLWVRETLDLGGNAGISGLGGTPSIVTNAITSLTISLENSAVLKGDAFSGPGGDPQHDIQVRDEARITGQSASLDSPVSIALPPTPAMAGPYPDRTYASSTQTLGSDLYCDDLLVMGNATLQIDGTVSIFATGSVSVQQFGKIQLRPGAKLAIFCKGSLQVLDQGIVNADGGPGRVVINCAGSRADMRNGAQMYATVVAPAAVMRLNEQAQLFGSFLGRQLIVESQAQVHYDLAGPATLRWME